MKKYTITSFMLLVLFGQAYFFGVNDWLTLAFILITAGFLYVSLIKIHSGNRKMLRVNSKQDSWLHTFLSQETTVAMRSIAILSSLTLSTLLVVLIKGMVLQQGYIAFFFIITVASLLLYSLINKNINSDVIDKNVNTDIAEHGSELARIFYAAIILNLILAFTFSAYDTFVFKTSDVNFTNFTDKAVEVSFDKNSQNKYSRILINAYLLMDFIKIALAKMFVDLFNLKDNFYGFYIITFALNAFKLFAFSFSFVLLQKGFDGTASFFLPHIKTVIDKTNKMKEPFNRHLSNTASKVKSTYHSRTTKNTASKDKKRK